MTATAVSDREEVARQAEAVIAAAKANGRTVELVPFTEIEAKSVEWLWTGRIALGQLNLLYGTEGLGKSGLTVGVAARVSRGELPGTLDGEPSKVAFVTTEDDPESTIRPRLEAAGADLSKVVFVRVSRYGHDDVLALPEDSERLAAELEAAEVRLVIIDPITAALGPQVKNAWDDRQVRAALAPFVAAAQRSGFAIWGVLHTNRQNTTDSRNRAGGSIAWRQVARTAAVLGLDPDDPSGDTRVLAFDKNNLAPKARSIRVALTQEEVCVAGTRQTIVAIALGKEVDFVAADLLAAEAGSPGSGEGQLDRAMGMLYDLLAEGPKAVMLIREEAQQRGIGWRTVEQAKGTIGIEAERLGAAWVWCLNGTGLDI